MRSAFRPVVRVIGSVVWEVISTRAFCFMLGVVTGSILSAYLLAFLLLRTYSG